MLTSDEKNSITDAVAAGAFEHLPPASSLLGAFILNEDDFVCTFLRGQISPIKLARLVCSILVHAIETAKLNNDEVIAQQFRASFDNLTDFFSLELDDRRKKDVLQ
jgi:hypothetical protein